MRDRGNISASLSVRVSRGRSATVRLLLRSVKLKRSTFCARFDAGARLDLESEGLILFTNDGEFCLRLTHPRYNVTKVYLATVRGSMDDNVIRRITAGVQHDGELLKALKARTLASGNSTSLVEVVLGEGKNREVRRLFESQGLEVIRLVRTQIGKIRLAQLPSGKWRTLTDTEVKTLLSPT